MFTTISGVCKAELCSGDSGGQGPPGLGICIQLVLCCRHTQPSLLSSSTQRVHRPAQPTVSPSLTQSVKIVYKFCKTSCWLVPVHIQSTYKTTKKLTTSENPTQLCSNLYLFNCIVAISIFRQERGVSAGYLDLSSWYDLSMVPTDIFPNY